MESLEDILNTCSNDTRTNVSKLPSVSTNFTIGVGAFPTVLSMMMCVAYWIFKVLAARRAAHVRSVSVTKALFFSQSSEPHLLSVASLEILRGIAFFLSASAGFDSRRLNPDLCLFQAVLYQFSYCGIILEVAAVSLEMFEVLVRNRAISDIRSRNLCRNFGLVYGLSLALALLPLLLQVATEKPFYSSSGLLAFCWLNARPNCILSTIYFFFIVCLAVLAVAVSLCGVSTRRWCKLQHHVRSGVRELVQLYYVRRALFLAIMALLILNAALYFAVNIADGRTWHDDASSAPLGYFGFVSFLEHCDGLLCLLIFIVPDATLLRWEIGTCTGCGPDSSDDDQSHKSFLTSQTQTSQLALRARLVSDGRSDSIGSSVSYGV